MELQSSKKDGLFAIYSVYYDDEGKVFNYSVDPEPAIASNIEELKTQLTLMMEATDKEIIEFENLDETEIA